MHCNRCSSRPRHSRYTPNLQRLEKDYNKYSDDTNPSPTRRHPDNCPHHPDQIVYYSTTQQASGAKIIQHRCAQDRCNQPIGWYFTGNQQWRTGFAHGPSLCNDRQILARMDRARYDDHTYGTVILPAGLTVMTAITGTLMVIHVTQPPIWTIATASTLFAAGAAAYRTLRNRRRPQELENTSL